MEVIVFVICIFAFYHMAKYFNQKSREKVTPDYITIINIDSSSCDNCKNIPESMTLIIWDRNSTYKRFVKLCVPCYYKPIASIRKDGELFFWATMKPVLHYTVYTRLSPDPNFMFLGASAYFKLKLRGDSLIEFAIKELDKLNE